jgi:hypothetical protein
MEAALTYRNANNLGDDIQTLAAMQFIEPECFVDRDAISGEQREVELIGNAFWSQKDMVDFYGQRFNPPDNVKMLPVSMHISGEWIKLDWFKKNQPIGCRDKHTVEFFKAKGIDAYFTGCLTLTFPEYKGKREKRILLIGEVGRWENVKFPEGYEVIHSDPVGQIPDKDNVEQRLEMAKELLDFYRKSSLVISSKVHGVFPCIALGTPVIAVRQEWNVKRLSGHWFIPEWEPHDIVDIQRYKIPRPEAIINKLKELCG